jgi:hypothetical protein
LPSADQILGSQGLRRLADPPTLKRSASIERRDGEWEETVEQKQRRSDERSVDKRDSAEHERPRRPRTDPAYAGDRPTKEGGLLRELKENPRHLD